MNKEQKTPSIKEIHSDSIKESIYLIIKTLPEKVDVEVKKQVHQLIKNNVEQLDFLSQATQAEDELNILFTYQQNYLNLIREYKEEIKFLNTTQEDLRKERSRFFSQTLQEVNESLKASSIDEKLSQKWIQQLVNSYTNSLDTSSELVESQAISTIEEMKKRSEEITKNVKKNK